jgi:hypothetical protein
MLEVRSVLSEAAVLFESGEQLAADLPVFPVGVELLKRRYGLEVVGLQQADQTTQWLAQKGQVRIGERTLAVESARGNQRLLSVVVHGSSEEAFDALQELWTTLSQAAAEIFRFAAPSPVDFGRVQSLGKSFTSTVAVVRLPHDATHYFPQLAFLQNRVGEHIAGDQFRLMENSRLRFTCEFKMGWGARMVVAPLTIEPRANEPLDSRIFFTKSPLKSEAHLDLVRAFVEEFGPRK